MAKAWIFSDLHQEFVTTVYGRHPRTAFDPARVAPDHFDIVLVPGDVSVPLGKAIDWLADRFAGVPLVYVPGNHDYYSASQDRPYTMEAMLADARERADRRGIHLLSDASVELAGLKIVGATLWTDFSSVGAEPLEEKLRQAGGLRGLNDFRVIWRENDTKGHPLRLRPEDTIRLHHESRRFIEEALRRPFDGRTIVMTHHAPHPNSLHSRFGGLLDYCFASNLEPVLIGADAPAAWLHGHVHHAVDYTIGKCRVVCNPRGYAFADQWEGQNFVPGLVLDTKALAGS